MMCKRNSGVLTIFADRDSVRTRANGAIGMTIFIGEVGNGFVVTNQNPEI